MCSRLGIVKHKQDWVFPPPPLGGASGQIQAPRSRYRDRGSASADTQRVDPEQSECGNGGEGAC